MTTTLYTSDHEWLGIDGDVDPKLYLDTRPDEQHWRGYRVRPERRPHLRDGRSSGRSEQYGIGSGRNNGAFGR